MAQENTRASKRKGFLAEERVRGTVAARDQQAWDCVQATDTPPDKQDKAKRPDNMDPTRLQKREYPLNWADPVNTDMDDQYVNPGDQQNKKDVAMDQAHYGKSPKANRRG